MPDLGWEGGYVRYRPLLFSVLSRLARQGLVVRPDDGLDLIHDFFSETWNSIVRRFDPAKGKFEPYLYACFLHFARPRVIRQMRWQGSLVPLEGLAEISDQRSEEHDHPHDIASVRRAMSSLPDLERKILLAYVSSNGSSERKLADQFNLTRFRLRSYLADSLSRLAVSLEERTAFDETEWAVLQQLSHEGRTVKETARALNLTAPQVQTVRARVLARLIDAGKASPRRLRMDTNSPEALLQKALDPATDTDAAAALVQKHAETILSFLESDRADAFFAAHSQDLDSDRIAAIYAALGFDEGRDSADTALCERFLVASREEEASIGTAFSEVLLPALPVYLRNFDAVFRGSEPLPTEDRNRISRETSVVHGGKSAEAMAAYGVTPVVILEACEGIANLARRYCDDRDISVGQFVVLDKSGRDVSRYKSPTLARREAIEEVVLMTELSEKHAERLFDWISRVAEYIPRLFNGFDSALWGDELRLTRTDETWMNFFEMWAPLPPEKVAA
ncbi:MAG: hypothetical protein HYX38_18380 [Rhodospirillales bacterium]|nr:hypothetical protein [Rhodospirillales bacterium]